MSPKLAGPNWANVFSEKFRRMHRIYVFFNDIYLYLWRSTRSISGGRSSGSVEVLLTVTVCQDNVGTLATELHRRSLHVALDGHHAHLLADLRRPGERHLVHVQVPGDGGAGRRTVPGNNVHHTRRKPGLHTSRKRFVQTSAQSPFTSSVTCRKLATSTNLLHWINRRLHAHVRLSKSRICNFQQKTQVFDQLRKLQVHR